MEGRFTIIRLSSETYPVLTVFVSDDWRETRARLSVLRDAAAAHESYRVLEVL